MLPVVTGSLRSATLEVLPLTITIKPYSESGHQAAGYGECGSMDQIYEGAAPGLRPLLAAITRYHLTAFNAQSITIGL